MSVEFIFPKFILSFYTILHQEDWKGWAVRDASKERLKELWREGDLEGDPD